MLSEKRGVLAIMFGVFPPLGMCGYSQMNLLAYLTQSQHVL